MNKKKVTIIGGGLSGCEAALQLSANGFSVKLYDLKPYTLLPVYSMMTFGELVCNSSLGSDNTSLALGALLGELRIMGSKIIAIADECRVKDAKYLAVDKSKFSQKITEAIYNSGIEVLSTPLHSIPNDDIVIIATGPLTDDIFARNIASRYSIHQYHFSDASSPVIDIDSIDLNNQAIVQISDDLYSVTLDNDTLNRLYDSLKAYGLECHHAPIDKDISFENSHSIEFIAQKGIDYLIEKKLQNNYIKIPNILLRRENGLQNGFILVGCMTTLSHSFQKATFSLLPGFENVKFIKYGRMHRNTYFKANTILNCFYRISNSHAYIIGQLSGIDGYAPAISSGLVASIDIICNSKCPALPACSVIGGLANYVSNPNIVDFEPMCASFSLLPNGEYYYKKAKHELIRFKNILASCNQ